MTKNITLSITDDLVKAMKKFPNIKWSVIATEAFESYLEKHNDYCKKSPILKHEWGEPIPGLAGNTGFECKHCKKFEWDD